MLFQRFVVRWEKEVVLPKLEECLVQDQIFLQDQTDIGPLVPFEIVNRVDRLSNGVTEIGFRKASVSGKIEILRSKA
jgi:hypothetical protein